MRSESEPIPGTLAARASIADRERAIDVLKAAFAEGRLSPDEYADRVEMVLKSATYADLARLTSDLPAGPLGSLTTAAAAASPMARSFDWPSSIMCGTAALMVALFAATAFPSLLLLALFLNVSALVRSVRSGPRWERYLVWGAGGVVLASLALEFLNIFG
jgi:Domain of unknown function (DUF1707)